MLEKTRSNYLKNPCDAVQELQVIVVVPHDLVLIECDLKCMYSTTLQMH